ncbi:uncharacterized protein [Euphorbia lathyris]|uniref:uncharacterized protein n=1 Tax=Euphorbia lathyris TaxID=212925 RepID=UPI003313DA43
MDLIPHLNLRTPLFSFRPSISFSNRASLLNHNFPFSFRIQQFSETPIKSYKPGAKKKNSQPAPALDPTLIEQVSMDPDDEGQLLLSEDIDDEAFLDGEDENFEDEYLEDEAELCVGDGSGGGGTSLAGTWWDKEALRIAEEVCQSFDGQLKLYAFKTLSNSTIQVRIERLTNKSGSPNMEDIQAFSKTYREWLDEAELAKSVPENLALEVSSPGVERVVRVPDELDRFKDRAMYVKYMSEEKSSSESDGVLRLICFDIETKCCTWGLADVKINREKAGKGRPLNKKQKEWRLITPFDSLRLVRIYPQF